MRKCLLQIAFILIVGVILGAGINAVRSDGLTWSPRPLPTTKHFRSIPIEDFAQHVQQGTAVIVDARSAQHFAEGHVETALHIPAAEKDQYTQLIHEQIPRESMIIIYCQSATCELSEILATHLEELGFQTNHIFLFAPGWEQLRMQSTIPLSSGGSHE